MFLTIRAKEISFIYTSGLGCSDIWDYAYVADGVWFFGNGTNSDWIFESTITHE